MKINKDIIWLSLILILSVILVYNSIKPNLSNLNDVYIKKRFDSLKSENKTYLNMINLRDLQVTVFKIKIDSLNKKNDSLQKAKKPIIYTIGKYENFKSPNYIASADTMHSIFTENNIK
jgi:hypothetical protein